MEPTELLDCGLHRTVHVSELRHVAVDTLGSRATRTQLFDGLIQGVLFDVEDDDICALSRKSIGDATSDPLRTPGDQDDLAGKSSHRIKPAVVICRPMARSRSP